MPRWPLTTEDRFWSKVDKIEFEPCWAWTAAKIKGYGTLTVDGMHVKAHRYAYELLVGPIPDGLTIDHLCRNPSCVNPVHLEPVTIQENLRRAAAAQTHCKWGHEYTPENTYLDANDYRRCRTCNRELVRRRRAVRY